MQGFSLRVLHVFHCVNSSFLIQHNYTTVYLIILLMNIWVLSALGYQQVLIL